MAEFARLVAPGGGEGRDIDSRTHLGRGPDEAADSGISAFYDGLLE